jgi:long-chain acyl-CoA synthetase
VGEVLAKGPNVMSGYLDDAKATGEVLAGGWLRTGDLGRLTDDGHLALVGRKKDIILDASGKNVYPDELEELYAASPLVKELSIVGLPDEKGHERVACLCVPYKAEDRRAVEEHFARVSADLPFAKRVKILHFWEADLPKTATRKVKRPLVVAEMVRLERAASAGALAQPSADGRWLYELLADLAQKPRGSVDAETRLAADLGFDSLLVAELTVALEKAGVKPPPESAYAAIATAASATARRPRRWRTTKRRSPCRRRWRPQGAPRSVSFSARSTAASSTSRSRAGPTCRRTPPSWWPPTTRATST